MYSISLEIEKYKIIFDCCKNLKLNSFQASWDGRGGIDFLFVPEIIDKNIENDLAEVLQNTIEEIKINWNLDFTITSFSDSMIEIDMVETRNLSEYDEITLEDSDFISGDLINYLTTFKNINPLDFESVIELRQIGNSKDSFEVEHFSFTLFDDENEIDLSNEETENLISSTIHRYIINECAGIQEDYEYLFEYEQGYLNFEITLEKKTLIIKPS